MRSLASEEGESLDLETRKTSENVFLDFLPSLRLGSIRGGCLLLLVNWGISSGLILLNALRVDFTFHTLTRYWVEYIYTEITKIYKKTSATLRGVRKRPAQRQEGRERTERDREYTVYLLRVKGNIVLCCCVLTFFIGSFM